MKPLLATGVKTCVINVLFKVELKVLVNIRIIWTRKIYLYKMPFLIKIFNMSFIRWNAITSTMNKNSLEIISGIFPFKPLRLYDKKKITKSKCIWKVESMFLERYLASITRWIKTNVSISVYDFPTYSVSLHFKYP